MLDNSQHRIELDALRAELLAAWAEVPFPTDRVADINSRMKQVLKLVPVQDLQPAADRSAAMKRAWVHRRARIQQEKQHAHR